MGLYDFTRCYTISCFKGIGKVEPTKVLDKNEDFEFEDFVCLLYSQKQQNGTNESRVSIFQEKCGGEKTGIKSAFSLQSLPLCRDILKQHIRRENHQV